SNGVEIDSGVLISSTGAGAIGITGTGGNDDSSEGVLLTASSAPVTVSSVTGDITITGTGNSGADSYGIHVKSGGGAGVVIESTGTANITLTGTTTGAATAILSDTFGAGTNVIGSASMTGDITLAAGPGDDISLANIAILGTQSITLSADSMAFAATSQIGGTGIGTGSTPVVTLQPRTAGTTIDVGAAGTGTLVLTSAMLDV